MDKQQIIGKYLANMTLEQKVGQCFVLGAADSILTPVILERIRKFHPAGMRCSVIFRAKTTRHDSYATGGVNARIDRKPQGNVKDYMVGLPVPHCSNEEYCAMINQMKQAALDSGGIPLHTVLDMEGGFSSCYCFNRPRLFPEAKGIGQTGDPHLAYEIALALARQLTPIGFDWIHSPVLDVNTEPMNKEISSRSYADNPEEVARFALEALRGFREGNLIATGKHFPGRGNSRLDAHKQLSSIDLSREEMFQTHIAPYKPLIEAGLPAVMTAHALYPGLDPSGRPATVSKTIITDILKGELGFTGAVTTDAITMGGIIANYEATEACIEAINAGCDLVLLRDDSPLAEEILYATREAARSGRISEERLNDAVSRTLGVKYDYGLFETDALRDASRASDGQNDTEVIRVCRDAAERTTSILRDAQNLLPIPPEKSVLLIEQVNELATTINNQYYHPGILWKKMFQIRPDIACVETPMKMKEEHKQRVYDRLDEADVIVMTNYFWRRGDSGFEFVKELCRKTQKPIVVINNNPFPVALDDTFKTVVLTSSVGPEALECVARLILEDTET